MTFKALMLTAAVAVIAAAPAMANDTPVAPPAAQKTTVHHHVRRGHAAPLPMMFFDKMDTNHDGVVTKQEWMDDAADKFADIDVNHDGKITKKEIWQFHKTMEQHHPEWTHHHPMDRSWSHEDHTTYVQHTEYYGGNRPNMAAPGVSTSAPPAYNEVDPTRRSAGADGAGGWTAQ